MSAAQARMQQTSEITAVQYHPSMPHLFVTGDKAGNVYLRDVRMAFGPRGSRSQEGVVQRVRIMTPSPYGHLPSSVCHIAVKAQPPVPMSAGGRESDLRQHW